MEKNVILSDEELELLITSLHCVDEKTYNCFTRTNTPWSEAKEMKKNSKSKTHKSAT